MHHFKIAYISYEYPPDTSGGGIGSYIQQIAGIMNDKGHKVHVFCGTDAADYYCNDKGVEVYKINSFDKESFRKNVVTTFSKVYAVAKFDLIEGPEYGADGYEIKKAFPLLPYIVKCHSPSYIVSQFNNYFLQYVLPLNKLAMAKNAIRRFFNMAYYPFYNKENDIEYVNVKSADTIFSPSVGLARKLSKDWAIDLKDFSIIPNPYSPSTDMLSIPLEYKNNRITFLGKLSVLKGMIDIISAIPIVLKNNPALKFRFIGQDGFAEDGSPMSEYLLNKCCDYKENIEIVGKVSLSDIPKYLSETDIVLCTSLWENYPTVILEAFSAGRCVVATRVGGIPEIVQHNKNGVLVEKKDPKGIASEILRLYSDQDLMLALGRSGRESIHTFSGSNELYKIILDNYIKALSK